MGISVGSSSFYVVISMISDGRRATRIRKAIDEVISNGKVRTYDMMKFTGSPDVLSKGAASCEQMTDAIIERL